MKTFATILVLIGLPVLVLAQVRCPQQEYKGEVTFYTPKGRGLSRVPVVIDGNQGPYTDANGVFRYPLSKCPGMTVQIRLASPNYDIVNHTEVYTYTLRQLADPADFQFKLLVAEAKGIEQARRNYYTEITGVAVDKGLTLLKGEIEKLTVLERQQLKEQRITNQTKTADQQQQRKVDELEKRLERQQKEYQRALDSLYREPDSLKSRVEELQKLLERQRQENQQLLDGMTTVPGQQPGKVYESERVLEKQQQANQRFVNKLADQDSTQQQDKTRELLKILEQQRRENKKLLDSLTLKEQALQKSRVSLPAASPKVENQELNQLRDSLNRMKDRYELALSERDKRLSEAQAMARVFAHQTEVDSSYQQAFSLYKEGQFKGALAALSDEKLNIQKAKLKNVAGEQPGEFLRERAVYISKCLLKANIYRSQYDMNQAAHWYKEAVLADSAQVENLIAYANFLHQQNRPQEPEQWYQKALALNPSEKLTGDIYTELGYYYIANNRVDEAQTALLEARAIKQKLALTDAKQYEPSLAHALDGLGTLYLKKRQYDEAEKAFVQARNIREQLVEKYPDEFEADLAISLNNLGTFYYSKRRFGEAGKTYLRAKNIQDRLVGRNADQYEPALASTLGNLGTLNYGLDRLSDAETAYQQAKTIREKLAQKNPDQYEPGLAQVLNDLGDLYTSTKRYKEAEAAYQQAKTIREKLAQKNPDQFESDLAQTLTDVGLFYVDTKRYPEAQTAYVRAKTIQEKLAGKYPDLFEPNLANTLADMGFYYAEVKRYKEAEAAYEQARTIQEKIVQKRSKEFEPDLAYTLTDIGNFYFDTKNTQEAKGAYVKAKNLLENLVSTDGGQLSSLLIQILHRVGMLSDSVERKRYFLEADSLQEQTVELVIKQYGDADSSLMARELSNWSYHLLFSKKFAKAEVIAEKALAFDETEEWVNANLAVAYLMQGKLEDAKTLYGYLKNKPNRSGRYKKTFLADLDELETAGITHPDMATIRKLLN